MGKLTEVDVKLGGNKISPMSRAIEECAELIQALIKVERFGWFNYHPLDVDRTTNMEFVRREADDVCNALDKLDNHMRDVAYNHYNREDRKPVWMWVVKEADGRVDMKTYFTEEHIKEMYPDAQWYHKIEETKKP